MVYMDIVGQDRMYIVDSRPGVQILFVVSEHEDEIRMTMHSSVVNQPYRMQAGKGSCMLHSCTTNCKSEPEPRLQWKFRRIMFEICDKNLIISMENHIYSFMYFHIHSIIRTQ